MADDPIDGRIVHPGAPVNGPRCRMHEPMVGPHGVWGGDYPAHTWTSDPDGKCGRCPSPVVRGDLYLCDVGGIMHAKCPPMALTEQGRAQVLAAMLRSPLRQRRGEGGVVGEATSAGQSAPPHRDNPPVSPDLAATA